MKLSFEIKDEFLDAWSWLLTLLGHELETGEAFVQDFPLAFACFQAATVEDDDPDGMNGLGWMYQNGLSVSPDIHLAMEWYHKAVEKGCTTAMINLGNIYEEGFADIPRDYSKALYWYQQAAENGDPVGKFNCANMYHHGWGVVQDRRKAFEIFSELFDEGYSNAAFYMGLYHQLGEVVEQDYAAALDYYLHGTEMDDDKYCYNQLGVMYGLGLGVKKDVMKAIEYYMEAASRGDYTAHANLAYFYEVGEGVEQNLDEALRLYRIAAEEGEENGMEGLKRLENNM